VLPSTVARDISVKVQFFNGWRELDVDEYDKLWTYLLRESVCCGINGFLSKIFGNGTVILQRDKLFFALTSKEAYAEFLFKFTNRSVESQFSGYLKNIQAAGFAGLGDIQLSACLSTDDRRLREEGQQHDRSSSTR
jgi:hypothetical protein